MQILDFDASRFLSLSIFLICVSLISFWQKRIGDQVGNKKGWEYPIKRTRKTRNGNQRLGPNSSGSSVNKRIAGMMQAEAFAKHLGYFAGKSND